MKKKSAHVRLLQYYVLPSNRIYDLIKIRELVVASCIDEAVNFNSSFSK